MTDIPVLATERLTLRAWREEDFESYAEMVGHSEVARFLPSGPLSRADAWRQMAMAAGHWSLRGYGPFAVERLSDGQIVGRIGLWNPEGWPAVELIWTLRRAYWGMGYATEAARAVMDHSFETLLLPQISSHIDPDNTRSRHVAERLGQTSEKNVEIITGGKAFAVESWGISHARWALRKNAA
ncbi:MAG: hypothetical protein RJB62_884 [Pseudomonadota bacterium]|jgi:RimJ/RimL family protein N-acetyltransferase